LLLQTNETIFTH